MPKFDVVMPNPHNVSESPRKETVEAPDEHSARIVAAERFGRQATEISEHKAAPKAAPKKAKKAAPKKAAPKKQPEKQPEKQAEKQAEKQPEFKPANGSGDK